MDKADKIRFINELVDNIRTEVLAKVDRMPDNWDGHELRALLAAKFADAASFGTAMRNKRRARWKEFQNTCIVKNL